MMNTVLKIKLIFSCLISFILLSFQSCSEEDSVVDVAREQKVQELLRVSRALADKHEIAMCFTEQMIRGGVDTLTTEDLERAYEVYAANTVEFYVCTDSAKANANGLKLSRTSRIVGEDIALLPHHGGTLIGEYNLQWTPSNNVESRLAIDYSGLLRVRIDWGFYIMQGTATYYFTSSNNNASPIPVTYFDLLNHNIYLDSYNELVYETEASFSINMDGARCDFMVWGHESIYARVMRVTLCYYTSNSNGTFALSNDGIDVYV